MKQKKRLAWLLLAVLLLSVWTPARATVYAAQKQFTYAEQKSSARVETLVLAPGDKVDLKFMGIKDYRDYTLKWVSSDEAVATVDKQGIITAKAVGEATVRLMVGDGSRYTSKGVKVTVRALTPISLGTSKNNIVSLLELPLGTTIDLNFYGVAGWNALRYSCSWTSTQTAVATVNALGIVTPHQIGTTIILLTLTDSFTGKQLEAVPVAVSVVAAAAVTPKPTVSVAPTPTVTPKPTGTPTPTPVPTLAPGTYSVAVASSSSVTLQFPSAVTYTASDIHLYRVFQSGSQSIESDWSIASVTKSSDGTRLTVEAVNSFSNGDTYIVRVGTGDAGTRFTVSLGAPNRIVVSYECLGASGVAYAQTSVDAPVTLSYRLYYNEVDVTKEYSSYGYVDYELLSPKDSYLIDFNGSELTFYEAKQTAVLVATYHYGTNYRNTIKSSPVSIVSRSLGAYSVNMVEEWTIIDDAKNTAIDWSQPVHAVTAGTSGKKLVLLLKDMYGIRYATDPRGVNEAQEIYSIEDESKLFAAIGCTITLESVYSDKLWVDDSGMLDPVAATSRATVIATLHNYQADSFRETRIGSFTLNIRKEAELSSIAAETKSVTLVTEALPGFEDRFCKTTVEILAYDQYGEPWNGGCYLDLRCTANDVNNALGTSSGPAYLDGTTLHLDAHAIGELTTRSSLSFVVTEVTLNKKVTITVTLKTPVKKDNEISIGSWEIGTENIALSFADQDALQTTRYGSIELFQLSKNGLRVGLHPGYSSTAKVTLTTDKSIKLTSRNSSVGDIFVYVIAPNGKTVAITNSPNSLGLYWDADSQCIRVIAAAPDKSGSSSLSFLAAGNYTVRAMKVTAINTNGTATYVTKNATFTITDNTPSIAFRDASDTKSATYVTDKNDLGDAAAIVAELFSFTKDGAVWTDWDADMITGIDFTWRDRYILIKSVTFSIPAENGSGMTYQKTVSGINRTVRYGVEE